MPDDVSGLRTFGRESSVYTRARLQESGVEAFPTD